ncbi:MAG TPA: hypothetical protein PKW15_02530 [Alphaproteobacteria bacterium]|mgnify:CR=1 FL=1|nr:hypothetical protein [Rhodospirillaceae bacterium]HRJ12100.1 hypothetical protein [Alphaproteobacteria bacterium]
MIVSNFKTLFALGAVLLLSACVPPPAGGEMNAAKNHEMPPIAETKTVPVEEAALPETKPAEAPAVATGEVRTRSSAQIRMARQPADEISLWQTEEDENAGADRGIWDGARGKDVVTILPTLVNSDNKRVQNLIRHIAMSAVYIPEGMDGMAYTQWRADVLAAQNRYADASRLLNVARIGRDDSRDVESRIALQLANNQTESACLEAMATRNTQGNSFWQGLEVLCANTLGDAETANKLRENLPDGEMKLAAEKMGNSKNNAALRAALVSAAAINPDNKPLADNEELLRRLKRLMYEINDDEENREGMIAANKGQLMLLALGALSADKKGEDTDKVTKQALEMAGV